MSKMSNLMVEIQDLYINGYDPEVIALMCEVPVSWVYEVFLMMDSNETAQFNLNQ